MEQNTAKQSMTKTFRKISYWIPIVCFAVLFYFLYRGYRAGIFESEASISHFVSQYGRWAPIMFILLQAIQVIVPILPGGISCGLGILLFGTIPGFFYNYIGIVAGEIIGFLLVRHYGRKFIYFFLTEKQMEKFYQLMERQNGNIKKVLIIVLLVPFMPDDIACLMCGMTNLSLKDYLKILLPLKIWAIGIYSLMMLGLIHTFVFR